MVLQTPADVRRDDAFARTPRSGRCSARSGGRVPEAEALERADEALGFVGLAGAASDRRVGSLNLHEQRFLELARALAGRPRLLLLDEVMAGLNDTELRASIDIVRTARDQLGVTVIWVEHVMKAVMSLAERVVVLNFGRILVDGPPEVAMRDPEVVAAYLGTAGLIVMLEVAELSAGYLGEDVIHQVSLSVAEGEVGRGHRLERRREDDAVPRRVRAAPRRRAGP